jgi:hypothetical protein
VFDPQKRQFLLLFFLMELKQETQSNDIKQIEPEATMQTKPHAAFCPEQSERVHYFSLPNLQVVA